MILALLIMTGVVLLLVMLQLYLWWNVNVTTADKVERVVRLFEERERKRTTEYPRNGGGIQEEPQKTVNPFDTINENQEFADNWTQALKDRGG